ncbi:flagellar protein FlbD [Caldicoprobacter guelmensis]|uniref:flagellar FlbD family protein n=1 Tax=Caldicoprobacter guelmensis TaxID=1170224 RepID=UPI00195E7EB5|nr:flagellar FlbD family protein [Caldicoprobacter guelmensis]MBM7581386.1 flagellar protein FlbD [Caldicoprobacter guelmensis]
MIKVTRLNGEEFYINPDLIQYIEKTPNTVITLTNDKKVVVKEEVEEVIERIVAFKRQIFCSFQRNDGLAGE